MEILGRDEGTGNVRAKKEMPTVLLNNQNEVTLNS